MLPETPLLQLVPARAKATLKRLEQQIWLPPRELDVEWAGSSPEHVGIEEAKRRTLAAVSTPFFWGAREDQAWFRIPLPEVLRDGSWYLEWTEQGESTAYVDGRPYAGLDVGHLRCRIPEKCDEIWVEVMALETGIWVPGYSGRPAVTDRGCRFEGARARQRNDLAWDVFHDLHVLLDLLESEYHRQPGLRSPFGAAIGHCSPLENVSVLYRRLARLLDESICAYERGGLAAARSALAAAYAALRGQAESIRCRLSGHAHIDLVWLWTEKAGEFKAVHTFATANRIMESYPEFRFGYSQPASYRAVERRAPELMQSVRARIAEGRWEPVGASEVECDTLLACGEALVRCLLIGQEGFRDLQGRPSETMWLPDVFGYSACLPRILKETGVRYFFTTKLHWGSVTLFPYSSFLWEGSDGTRILSHVSQGMGYNMNVLPSEIRNATREYRQADIHDEMLMCCGYGDGGGGVTEEMCERARRIHDLAGTAASQWGRIDGFFEGLEDVRDRLPVYQGELFLQYHRGVFTTHSDLKEAFRAAERALQALEAVHVATGRGPVETAAWQRLVFAQFHDYIPGSSVKAVYAEAIPELRQLAASALGACAGLLGSGGPSPCLFNPLPVSRVVSHHGEFFEMGPLEGAAVRDLPRRAFAAVEASRQRLAGGRVTVEFTTEGRIGAFSVDGQSLAIEEPMGDLVTYHDLPHAFEAWDIDRSTLAIGQSLGAFEFVSCASGADEGRVTFRAAGGPAAGILIHYRLAAHSSVLDVEYEIDWREPDYLLKVLFPTRYRGAQARFGAPFGSVLRSQQPGQPYDEAQWEVPASRWALVADDGEREGLFVVTEARYGWSARGGQLGLSLLRSARLPDNGGGSSRMTDAPCSDIGTHRVRIALGRFDTNSPAEDLPAFIAESHYQPAIPYSGEALPPPLLGVDQAPSLVPCWAKPEGEKSWTLRLHETLGRRGEAAFRLRPGFSMQRIDLRGKPWPSQPSGQHLVFEPYEILSVRISRAP